MPHGKAQFLRERGVALLPEAERPPKVASSCHWIGASEEAVLRRRLFDIGMVVPMAADQVQMIDGKPLAAGLFA